MNILMIYPTTLDEQGQPIKYRKAFLPPLSLAILDGLTPPSHRVRIVNDVVEQVDFDIPYDLVAVTAMTTQARRAYQIAAGFRQKGVPVIMGGAHASILPDEAGLHVDSVVVGEVDRGLWESILADADHHDLRPRYQLQDLPDLQEFAIPRWDNVNMAIYPRRPDQKYPMLPVYTTRGCPFSCDFCSIGRLAGRAFRMRPVPHILKEINSTGARDFFFVDDNIVGSPEYSRELFRALAGQDITWFSQASVTMVKHRSLIDLAGRSGCTCLFIGLESVNHLNMQAVNKNFSKIGDFRELARLLRTASIEPFPSIIFGFDGDDAEVFPETLEVLRGCRVGNVAMWVLTPLPGTVLYENMEAAGRIQSRNWTLYDGNHVVFRPAAMTAAELTDLYWNTFRAFYSPRGILRRTLCNVHLSARIVPNLIEQFFYQLLFTRQVAARQHPFSAGLSPVNSRAAAQGGPPFRADGGSATGVDGVRAA